MDAFLRELKAAGSADLNGVLTTLNDGGLCREALRQWVSSEWIAFAPHAPLVALRGRHFSHELTLRQFCGEAAAPGQNEPETARPGSEGTRER